MSIKEKLEDIGYWFRNNIWDWIKYHTWDRYHIVDIRNKQCKYKYGYCDIVERIFYASFVLFQEFMEKEYPGDIDWEDADMIEIGKELKELYQWWNVDREIAFKKCDEKFRIMRKHQEEEGIIDVMFGFKETKEMVEWYKEYSYLVDTKDQEMLERLMKIRKHLWT